MPTTLRPQARQPADDRLLMPKDKNDQEVTEQSAEKHTPMMAQYVCMIFLARKYVAL